MSTKTFIKILINTGIGIGLILIWLQFVNLKEIISQIMQANLIFVFPAFTAILFGVFIRAIKLKLFLSPEIKIPLKNLFFLNGASNLFNFLIPIRAGEVLKGIYLGSNYNFPYLKSVTWIFLDRFIDFLTVLILTVILFFVVKTTLPINFELSVAAIFIIVIIISILMVYKPKLILSLYKKYSFLLMFRVLKIHLEKFLTHLLSSFSILRRSPKDLGFLFLLASIGYAADALVFYFLSASLNHPLSFTISYLSQLLSALTYLVPAGPGYVGSAEASGLLVFSGIFGMDKNLASALIVLFHIVMSLWTGAFGIMSVYLLRINPSQIFKKIFSKAS